MKRTGEKRREPKKQSNMKRQPFQKARKQREENH